MEMGRDQFAVQSVRFLFRYQSFGSKAGSDPTIPQDWGGGSDPSLQCVVVDFVPANGKMKNLSLPTSFFLRRAAFSLHAPSSPPTSLNP